MSLKNILNWNLLLITYGLNNDNVIREVPILMERAITLHFLLFQRKKTSKITNQHAQIISFWRLALNVIRSQKGTWNKHDKQDISQRFVDFQNGKA